MKEKQMKKSNLLNELEQPFVYDKCYLVYDQEPVVFRGHFEGESFGYVGIMVDLFDTIDYGGSVGDVTMNYYFARVDDATVYSLESKNYTLYDLFHSSPLVWVNHTYSESQNRHATLMRKNARMAERYEIAKDSTLCQQ